MKRCWHLSSKWISRYLWCVGVGVMVMASPVLEARRELVGVE